MRRHFRALSELPVSNYDLPAIPDFFKKRRLLENFFLPVQNLKLRKQHFPHFPLAYLVLVVVREKRKILFDPTQPLS